MKMALEDYRGDINMCCRCSACRYIPLQKIKGDQYSACCPSISKYNFHAYSGGGRLLIAREMLNNGFKYSEKLLDIIQNCQLCGACDVSCKYAMDMEVLDPLTEFRIKSIEDGKTNPIHDKIIATLRKSGTMVPGAPEKRSEWASGMNIKDYSTNKVEVIYYAGCKTSFDKNMWKVARSTASLLQKAGVNFGIADGNETCCGGRAYQMGYKGEFLNQAKKNMEMFKKSGAKYLVTGCADCYQAFKVLYDKFNLKGDIEVLHSTEYLARLIKTGKIKPKKKIDLKVTYHDPCRLGRQGEPFIHWQGEKVPGHRFMFNPPKTYRRGTNGIYGPPREIIMSIPGIQFKEMDRIKEYAWCCGSGGGVNESNPEFAGWTAAERIKEAESSGAQALVTACPWCESIFNQTTKETGNSIEVYDVVELLEKSI
jgi:Fe-S oxidoreductase